MLYISLSNVFFLGFFALLTGYYFAKRAYKLGSFFLVVALVDAIAVVIRVLQAFGYKL